MNNELRSYESYRRVDLPWVNEIPENWKIQRGKQLFKSIDERTTTGEEELLSVSANYGVVKRKNANVTMFKAASYVGYKLCWEKDLAVNSLWAWQQGLGFSKYHGIISTAYSVYRLRTENDNYKFYDYLLRSPIYLWELRVRSKGIWRSRYQLHDSSFMDMPFIVPPRLEQDQIVKYLDHQLAKINKFIKAKKKLIAVLKEQKQVVINEAVTKGLDSNVRMKSSGIEWLGDVPEHWEVGKLKKYVKLNPSMNDVKSRYTAEDNVVFLSMDKISVDGDIDNSELRLITDVRTGFTAFTRQDVVIAKITPCFENGKGAYLENLDTELGYGTTELIVIRPDQTRLLGKYLYYVTRCDYFRIFGSEVMTGSAGQKRVPSSFVVNFSIGFPGINEQKAIVSAIEKQHELINNSIKILNKEVELMMEYKNSLISNVVTGKVDVRNIVFDESEEEVIEDTELEEESIDEEILEVEDGDE